MSCLLFIFSGIRSSFVYSVLGSTFNGVSQGLAVPALWSIGTSALVDHPQTACRDMAMYYLATLLPQLVLLPLCGALLEALPSRHLIAYQCTWAMAAVLTLLALIPLRKMAVEVPQSDRDSALVHPMSVE